MTVTPVTAKRMTIDAFNTSGYRSGIRFCNADSQGNQTDRITATRPPATQAATNPTAEALMGPFTIPLIETNSARTARAPITGTRKAKYKVRR